MEARVANIMHTLHTLYKIVRGRGILVYDIQTGIGIRGRGRGREISREPCKNVDVVDDNRHREIYIYIYTHLCLKRRICSGMKKTHTDGSNLKHII